MSELTARQVALAERVQRWCVAILLALVAWFVAPGRIVPDTKIDLVVTPWRYLSRALDAWNTHTGLGELQNQAYGYLFPMGPLFGITQSVGVPAWASQRLWWSLLLVVAFLGAERLTRLLSIASHPISLLAGVAYALSPRVLTVLSEISVEAWPGALAPWFVVALVPALRAGASGADRRRAGIRTGLLCAALGGVNATASAVVVALPLLYLITAPRGRRRGRLTGWWAAGVALGSAWWVLPLLVLGRYAYPFMDYIESAATTTAVTSVSNVLRGASHWIAYILTSADNPVWQSGWVLAQTVTAIISTCVLAGLGLAGLVLHRRTLPHAVRFLLLSAVLATVGMAVGHTGTGTGPLALTVQGLLDGALSPLRNVHKADPLLRLPVAIGLAVLVGWLLENARRPRSRFADPRVAMSSAVVVGLAFAGSILPVWQGRVGDAWSFEQIPSSWRQMAALADSGHQFAGGATLLLPASRFADYSWGKPADEPLSALARSPVLVRGSAPLGHPGATRLLDEIERLATSGVAQESLSDTLQRLGVARVVLRRDLAPAAQAENWSYVEQTLRSSPGFRHVADAGEGDSVLSMYEVTTKLRGVVTTYAAQSGLRLTGGSEALPMLQSLGMLAPGTLAASAAGAAVADLPVVVTDTERVRSFNAGRPTPLAYGPTTTLDDPAVGSGARPDVGVDRPVSSRPHLVLNGLRSLTATSSAADPFSRVPLGPGAGPAAAIDGDSTTSWVPGDTEGQPGISFAFTEPVVLGRVDVTVGTDRRLARTSAVRLRVGSTVREFAVGRDGRVQADLGGVRGESLVIEPVRADPTEARPPGVAEVVVEGHPMSAVIAVPVERPTRVVLSRDSLHRMGDGRAGEDPASWSRRLVGPGTGSIPEVAATLRPRWGVDLDRVLDGDLRVQGSSRAGFGPTTRPGAVLDGDPTTKWLPGGDDRRPTLTVSGDGPLRLTTARLAPDALGTVTLGSPLRGQVTLVAGRDTDISVLDGVDALTVSFHSLPAGTFAPDLALAGYAPKGAGLDLGCDAGPELRIGSQRVRLAGSWTPEQVRSGAAIRADVCPAASGTSSDSAAGRDGLDLTMAAVPLATIEQVGLGWRPLPAPIDAGRVSRMSGDSGHLVATVTAGPESVLTLSQGANAGWRARTDDGGVLEPLTVDGWRQGFVLPADAVGEVHIDFTPNTAYRTGLLIGGAAGLVLLLAGVVEALARRRHRRDESRAHGALAEPTPAWTSSRATSLVGFATVALALLLGVLLAGWAGLAVGIAAVVLPIRWRAGAVLLALTSAGVLMSVLGVADRHSAGALAGQTLGSFVVSTLILTVAGMTHWPARPRTPAGSGPEPA